MGRLLLCKDHPMLLLLLLLVLVAGHLLLTPLGLLRGPVSLGG